MTMVTIAICRGLSHSTRNPSAEEFAEGRRALKAGKAILGLISRPILL
jgi:hypothetical protein